MRYSDIALFEYIKAPYATEIYNAIDQSIESSNNIDDLKKSLINSLQTIGNDILKRQTLVKYPRLKVFITDTPYGGIFRVDQDIDLETKFDLNFPPLEQNTVEIHLTIHDYQFENIMNHNYRGYEDIRWIGATFLHELIHAIQYCKSGDKHRSLIYYTRGSSRQKDPETGKRYGKRGKNNYHPNDSRKYYGSADEIEAFAAMVASEVIYRVRTDSNNEKYKYIMDFLKSLKINSSTLMNYRDLFKKHH